MSVSVLSTEVLALASSANLTMRTLTLPSSGGIGTGGRVLVIVSPLFVCVSAVCGVSVFKFCSASVPLPAVNKGEKNLNS